jgi:hypothetical protein
VDDAVKVSIRQVMEYLKFGMKSSTKGKRGGMPHLQVKLASGPTVLKAFTQVVSFVLRFACTNANTGGSTKSVSRFNSTASISPSRATTSPRRRSSPRSTPWRNVTSPNGNTIWNGTKPISCASTTRVPFHLDTPRNAQGSRAQRDAWSVNYGAGHPDGATCSWVKWTIIPRGSTMTARIPGQGSGGPVFTHG